jgi:hypothetical protein
MLDPKFKIQRKGGWYLYEPKPDITAYESAQLLRLLLVASHALVPEDMREAFISEYNLERHFTKENT